MKYFILFFAIVLASCNLVTKEDAPVSTTPPVAEAMPSADARKEKPDTTKQIEWYRDTIQVVHVGLKKGLGAVKTVELDAKRGFNIIARVKGTNEVIKSARPVYLDEFYQILDPEKFSVGFQFYEVWNEQLLKERPKTPEAPVVQDTK
jgi:hypothetical protein